MNVGIILQGDDVRERDPYTAGTLPQCMIVREVRPSAEGHLVAVCVWHDEAGEHERAIPTADLVPVNPSEESLRIAEAAGETIARWFQFRHLPPKLAIMSRRFAHLAGELVATLPRSAERTVALRKLLESKDAAVRAAL